MKIAFIPTKIENHLFDILIDTLDRSSIDKVVVFNNGNRDLAYLLDKNIMVNIIEAQGKSVYQMWNEALVRYKRYDKLILNDDVAFEPHLVSVLSMYLERDPNLGITFPDYDAIKDTGEYSLRYTDTTAGAGGMSGYCFMIRARLDVQIDENLQLYWGDDDLVKQVIAKGYKVGRVNGLPILHAGSFTINKMDANERQNLMEADRAYFNQKYGENRSPVV